MITLHPLWFGLAVLTLLASVAVAYFRRVRNFAGYGDIQADAVKIQKSVKGEVFRDGDDLVIGGNQGKYPVTIRFSYDENTPGLNIRMGAPANFSMSVTPRGAQATEGKVPVRTGDDMFDARFTTRSDQPAQAKMFLGGRKALALVQKLCCSNKTFVTVAARSLELSELVIPTPYTAAHIIDHVQKMEQLCGELASMPEAEKVKIAPYAREGSNTARILVYVLLAAAFVGFAYASYSGSKAPDPVADLAIKLPAGVLPVDADLMPNLDGWHVATADDYDPVSAAWIRDNLGDAALNGRIMGDFGGKANGRDVAYVLAWGDKSVWRVVVIADNASRYDYKFAKIAAATRLPRANLAAAAWTAAPPANIQGDGLLLVTDPSKPDGATVLFLLSDGKFDVARPADYHNLNLR